MNHGDDVRLDMSHAYYFRVQVQLHSLDPEFHYFVVWNYNYFFVERILPEMEFGMM